MAAHRSLQLASLAVRLGLLSIEQLQTIRQQSAPDGDFMPGLLESGWLHADDLGHLQYLLDRCLAQDPEWLFVTQLPAAMSQDGDATPPPPAFTLPDTSAITTAAGAPLSVGASQRRYRIRTLHATGGIGRVWIAEDETFGRLVALKDLRPEISRPAHQIRFLEEAKITARLEHPGIVPVYEMARRGEDGQPYYVMRFVKGQTLQEAIADYHQARRHGQAKSVAFLLLIQAFRGVGQTIAYAHAQGVLHRDLKPANILLGDFGEVLVLDWGLAKLDGSKHEAGPASERGPLDTHGEHSSATRAGQILGTPAYMSPEQAAGMPEAVDARSDVWGLGAILYEILTGTQPFRGSSLDDTLERVKQSPPDRPRAVNPDAPPALEAVCLKALAKDPAQRYASAAALTEEINRWLADEPVQARRETVPQRLARWARRHKTLVTTASALLIMAVIGLTISTILIDEQRVEAQNNLQTANEQHARAEANLKTALDAVETFYVQISENRLLNEAGMQPLRADLLRSAVKFCDKFAAENKDDDARRADLARVLLLLGLVRNDIQEPQQALQDLERALAIYTDLRQQAPTQDEWLRGEARAELSIGLACHHSDPERAKQCYESAAKKYELLRGQNSATLKDLEKLALTYSNLGVWLHGHGQNDQALLSHDKALHLAEELAQRDKQNRWYQHDLADFHTNIGNVLARQKKLADARRHYETSLALRERLAQENTKDLWLDGSRASSHNVLGNLCMLEKKYAEAEKHFRATLRLRQLVAQRNPSVPQFRAKLAWDHQALGRSLGAQDKQAEALTELGLAVETMQELQKEFAGNIEYPLELGKLHLDNARFQYDASQNDDALGSCTLALKWLAGAGKAKPAPAKISLVEAYWLRALVHTELRALPKAVKDYERALELDDGSRHDDLQVERQHLLGKLRMAEKKAAPAETHFRETLRLRKRIAQRQPPVSGILGKLAWDHYQLATSLFLQNKKPAAAAEIVQGVEVYQQVQKEFPKDAKHQAELGKLHLLAGYFQFSAEANKDAVASCTQAIGWLETAQKTNPTLGLANLLNAYWTRARAQVELGEFARAIPDFDHALKLDADKGDGSQRDGIQHERQRALQLQKQKKQ